MYDRQDVLTELRMLGTSSLCYVDLAMHPLLPSLQYKAWRASGWTGSKTAWTSCREASGDMSAMQASGLNQARGQAGLCTRLRPGEEMTTVR